MLDEDGVVVIENFINGDDLKNLNAELDRVFSQISINGSSYCNISEQRGALECSTPALLMSVNILEIIIDIIEQLKKSSNKFTAEDFVLNTLQIQSHKNVSSTPWHTDVKGYLRAVVYLKGGGKNSGMFSYIKGTFKEEYLAGMKKSPIAEPGKAAGIHWLKPEEIEEFSGQLHNCSAPAGSLVLFDDAGFHQKAICIEERRALWLAFKPRKDQEGISRTLLSSNNLTERVMENIHLFSNLEFNPTHLGRYNREIAYKNPKPLPLKYYFTGFFESLIFSILEGIRSRANSSPGLKSVFFNLQMFLRKFVAK